MGYDATEYNLLPRGSRDGAFLRRPDWWPELDLPAVPLPAIFAYLWEVALADWVVETLREVAYYVWEGHLLHVPDAMLAYFDHVDFDWFGMHAKFTTCLVHRGSAAIQRADWSRAVVEPKS